jgi:hypothetical protein
MVKLERWNKNRSPQIGHVSHRLIIQKYFVPLWNGGRLGPFVAPSGIMDVSAGGLLVASFSGEPEARKESCCARLSGSTHFFYAQLLRRRRPTAVRWRRGNAWSPNVDRGILESCAGDGAVIHLNHQQIALAKKLPYWPGRQSSSSSSRTAGRCRTFRFVVTVFDTHQP